MNKYLFLMLLIAITSCTTENGENGDNEDNTTDTVVINQKDTVWMPGETDTVTVREDEKEDKIEKEWTTGIVEREYSVRGNATLHDVRLARHNTFERVVIEFREQIPSYNIKYIDEPYTQCGSGKQLWLEGDGLLEIHLRNAAAHNMDGEPTVKRKFNPLDNVKVTNLACDYEGHVNLLLGVGSPNEFAVFELQDPARLVVDIRTGR